LDFNEKRKRNVFFVANIILMLTAFFFLPYNILVGNYILGILQGASGLILLGLDILVMYKRKYLMMASWIFVVLTAGFILYAAAFIDLHITNIIWIVAPYFLAMFLLGLHNGTIVSAVYAYAILLLLVFRYGSGPDALPVINLIDIGMANVFAFIFAAYYEKARSDNEKEMLRKNHEIEMMSNHDGLTGVFNRRYFDLLLNNEFHRSKREQQPLSLVIGDIDFFKNYNDTFGHLQGDTCLVEVADAINSAITRATDTVMRYGGEEFAVLLPNTNAKGAKVVAERIQKEMASKAIRHPLSSVSGVVTLSLGIAVTLQEDDHEPSDLVKRADKALYMSKSEGRNMITVL